jgi:hypothetical protein
VTRLAALVAAVALAAVASAAAAEPIREDTPLPVKGGIANESRVEPMYSRIASALARKPTEVRCWSTADWRVLVPDYAASQLTVAFVRGGFPRIHMNPTTCSTLGYVVYAHEWPTTRRGLVDLAELITTIGHESQHVKAVSVSEAAAECYGMQLIRVVAPALGINKMRTAQLANAAWTAYPSRQAQYRSRECRDGRSLDIRPGSHVWP